MDRARGPQTGLSFVAAESGEGARGPDAPHRDTSRRTDFQIDCRGRLLQCGTRPLVMGIVNCTPDSFYEGSRATGEAAVEEARRMAAHGADLIDVGGESTRPGSEAVTAGEEIDRVVPVIESIVEELDLPVSIDTRKAPVARAALEAGASMVNDVSGLVHDPDLAGVVADAGVPVILMHMRGEPGDMNERARYDDVIGEVIRELREAQARADAAGISREATLVDPGIGFAKTAGQSLTLLRHLEAFRSLGRPIVVGPSRKSFIGRVLDLPTEERLEGTAAAVAVAVTAGAHVVRVHDVREMRRVADLAAAIRTEGAGWIS